MYILSALFSRTARISRHLYSRHLLAIGTVALLSMATGAAMAGKGAGRLPYSYFPYPLENAGKVTESSPKIAVPTTRGPSFLLMGGGPDVDEGFRLMIRKAVGTTKTGGRFLVIRATGTDAYNAYIYDASGTQWTSYVGGKDLGLTSVETLIIPNLAAANHPDVYNIIQRADVLFIAGGDQSDYIKYWKGTLVQTAIEELMLRNVPIGGTSAGLAVLGQIDFAALNGTVTSPQALADPYNRYMTLDPNPLSLTGGFIAPPALQKAILDSHVDGRDRLGRLMTFVARMIGNPTSGCSGGILPSGAGGARGIGLGVETVLWVEADTDLRGEITGTRVTNEPSNSDYVFPDPTPSPSAVYFVRPGGSPSTCAATKPLAMPTVEVYRLADSMPFDLKHWFTYGAGAFGSKGATTSFDKANIFNATITAGAVTWDKTFTY